MDSSINKKGTRMFKLGNELVGILICNVEDSGLDASVINIRLFPVSIFLERHHDINSYEFRVTLFGKINLGIHFSIH